MPSKPKRELLDQYAATAEDRLLLGRLLDLADRADGRRMIPTRFLDPRQQTVAGALLRGAGLPFALFGGYEGAERRVVVLGRQDPPEDLLRETCGIVLLEVCTATEGLGHRDYLGALMGLQLERELIGDILVEPKGAQLLVCDGCADFLEQRFDGAGRAKLSVRRAPLSSLRKVEAAAKELRVTVASPRLDALLSAALPMSRSDAAAHIAAGRVLVSSLICQKPDRLLREGDTVTLRGVGRLVVDAFAGTTKKGRTVVLLRHFGGV